MPVWFEGDTDINCTLDAVVEAIEDDLGNYFTGVVSLMPGLSTVELAEQQPGAVTITTNEGVMKRTNVSTRVEDDSITVEFDEDYKAGSRVNVNSHSIHTFSATDRGVRHHLVIRDVAAPGFLGFFYRKLGSSKIGNALLTAEKTYLEALGS